MGTNPLFYFFAHLSLWANQKELIKGQEIVKNSYADLIDAYLHIHAF